MHENTLYKKFIETYCIENINLNTKDKLNIDNYKSNDQLKEYVINQLMHEDNIDIQLKNIQKYGVGVSHPSEELLNKLKHKYDNLFIENINIYTIYKFNFLIVYDFIKFKSFKYKYITNLITKTTEIIDSINKI